MKKTIALLTMVATGVALAGAVESTDTFGVLKITSSTAETVISVPWVAAGTGADVLVKDLVKTSNLTKGTTTAGKENADGDWLFLYSPDLNDGDGGYKGWFLNSSGAWEGLQTTYNNRVSAAKGGDDDTLKRGDALILIRKSVSDPIYLYGQYKTGPASYTITRAAGRKTLFAPVNVSGSTISLNSITWTNAQDGDIIQLQGSDGKLRTFTYDSSKKSLEWGRKGISTAWVTTGTEIQAGQGVWYTTVSGTGGNITVELE